MAGSTSPPERASRLGLVDAGQLLMRLARRAPERVVVRAPNTLPLLADADQLATAIGHLLDTALRHGAGPVELSASLTADGCVRMQVDANARGGAAAWIAVPTFTTGGGAAR